MEPLRIPGVGMRTVKTALAVAFCTLIYCFVGRSPAFACIGVIFGMGYNLEDARKNGGNRLFGTIIGGVLNSRMHSTTPPGCTPPTQNIWHAMIRMIVPTNTKGTISSVR